MGLVALGVGVRWGEGGVWIEFQIHVTQVVVESQLFMEVGAVLD